MLEATAERMRRLPDIGHEGLAILQRSRLALLGVGAIGGNSVLHAAQLGISMRLVDCDRVAPENLGSAVFPADSVGRWKSDVRVSQARALNPDCPVESVCARLEDLGLAALADCDLLLGGLDGRGARARLSELSCANAIPWLDGAVSGDGESLIGSVAFYDPRRDDGACYVCPHDSASLGVLAREERGPGCPSWRGSDRPPLPPTLQASMLPALVSSLQMMLAVRVLLGRGDEFANRRFVIDCGSAPRIESFELRCNPRCLGRHAALAPLRPAPGPTVGDLWADARLRLGREPDALRLHHRKLVLALRCASCGAARELARLAARVADRELVCACGAQLDPAQLLEEIRPPQLPVLAARRFGELGLPAADVVTAVSGHDELHYCVLDAGQEEAA